ncbi:MULTISPECIES: Rne/Rng family ribonuclease [unclassified Nocardioides]|uniref:Rne/Rng family ribonuclease n=1 Tax=unclassified Nocardioides TaxID=2615069 RepID=UPI000056FE1E|nr:MULTISPECIES: Rne/Rng family ribonuclease [unclassified Nocardioides]ABL82952.1 RNAse G [Nocardioides sp. JS614]
MPDDLQAGAEPTTDAPEQAPTAEKPAAKKATARKTAAKRTAKKAAAAEPADTLVDAPLLDAPADAGGDAAVEAPAKKTAAKKTAAKKAAAKKAPAKAVAKKSAAKKAAAEPVPAEEAPTPPHGDPLAQPTTEQAGPAAPAVLFQAPESTKPAKKTAKKAAAKKAPAKKAAATAPDEDQAAADSAETAEESARPAKKTAAKKTAAKKTAAKKGGGRKADGSSDQPETATEDEDDETTQPEDAESAETGGEGTGRRRRRRGGRRRRKAGDGDSGSGDAAHAGPGEDAEDASDRSDAAAAEDSGPESGGESGGESSSRRRRRRRRSGEDGGASAEDPEGTVTRVRSRRSAEDEITAVSGSTRLEAKKQRRREGREAGRRRAPIVSEAEFLARRESVDRVMVVRQREDLTQIGVLEDRVLVEHYVARESQTSLIGNVYLGRVQNVLPSMEAAFIDIGKGRNAVLYAGEVNWSALGHKDGQPRKIESVLSSGQSVLVQVTKDPIGHKGARLTSQISLAGRFLVYVPDGTTSGISRKLPDTERTRLKALLKEIVPDSAGVIVRTAAEGASEEELTRDVERLKARWEDIEGKAKGSAPQLLYGEPDLTLKVVRDLFTEDFSKLVIQGEDAWDTVQGYVHHVAPDLEARLERYDPGADGAGGKADVFAEYRIDEQIAKGLDRKVWLPSGGSLIIDRTEAMTVVDVNTGKFTGSGGNLEETVTKNNLEAAEEIVRQLRLRDIGGIIVVDFIDMVLESNRDLVLRRLVECLGRDRTRHQVAEVTSLGLVQMTRKRIGTGLLEAFSETCEHCQGRGVLVHEAPVEPRRAEDDSRRGSGRRGRGGRGRGSDQDAAASAPQKAPSPKDVAAMARPDSADLSTEAATDAATEAAVPEVDEVPPVAAEETPERPTDQPVEAAAPVETPPEPETPAEPEPPKVVTRSRRRSASRPAGTPTTATTATAPAAEPVAEPVVAEPVVAEPAEEAVPEAVGEPVPDPVPEPPKVVTRTRRRSASRPAGPPVTEAPASPASPVAETPPPGAIGSVGVPPVSGVVEPGTAEAETDDVPAIEHVPIKKKGSRKR